jgi:hypothetical protein
LAREQLDQTGADAGAVYVTDPEPGDGLGISGYSEGVFGSRNDVGRN